MTIGTRKRITHASSGRHSRKATLYATAALAAFAGTTAQAQVSAYNADVVGQGPMGMVVAGDGARLQRSDTGLNVSLRMPTPVPGSYNYPPASAFQPAAQPGHPEAYSLWVFVFNQPEECQANVPWGRCDSADFANGRGAPGAFNAGGHVVGGSNFQVSGRVTPKTEPFGGAPAASQNHLFAPTTAEVHLAVAPHGVLLPDVMPAQITTPIGNPSFWWLAFFPPAGE